MVAIRKILRLGRVGRFIDYSASGDVEFRRVNLIYGENAKGKSTLATVLRAAGAGHDAFLRGRKTLGESRDLEVVVLTDLGTLKYSNATWSGDHPNVAVFDQAFITDNIHVGDAVGANQRRNLYRVIVGEDAVAKAKELDELTNSNRQLANDLRASRQALTPLLPAEMSENEFVNYEPHSGLSDQIRKLEQRLADANNAAAIIAHSNLRFLDRIELEGWFAALLRKTLRDVEKGAEQKLEEHLKKHGMEDNGGEEWLAEGAERTGGRDCPFCDQDLAGSKIIAAYRAVFSEAYRELRDELGSAPKALSALIGERKISEITTGFAENEQLLRFWSDRVDFLSIETFDIAALEKEIRTVSAIANRCLAKKIAAPLEAVDFKEAAREELARLAEFNLAIDRYNGSVNQSNNAIDRFKSFVARETPSLVRAQLVRVQRMQSRADKAVSDVCERIRELEKTRSAQDERRAALRSELDNDGRVLSSTYEDRINELLVNFGATFSLGGVAHNYVGGVNASFEIVIRGKSVALGSADSPADQASFKNTLSSGDKSTLALAFFLAQLERDPLRKQRIVVLDDPFNSQDRFRRNQTAIEIAYLSQEVEQVVLFSHDAGFLSDVDKKLVDLKSKSMRLIGVGPDRSAIVECDLQGLLQQPIHGWIESLQRFAREGVQGQLRLEDIVQKIRPLLEAHCRNCCPSRFEDADMLSSMISKIRAEGETHRLYSELRTLSDIHDYSKRYHHDDGSVSGVIDESELAAYVRRTLSFVTGL